MSRGGWRVRGGGLKEAGGRGRERGAIRDDSGKCVEIVRTSTTVEVTWQDGSVEGGVPTVELVPVKHMGAHDFFPQEYVVDKLDEEPVEAMPRPDVNHTSYQLADRPQPDTAAAAMVEQDRDGAAAQREAGVEGGGSAGVEGQQQGGMLNVEVLQAKMPAHLIPTLQAARSQLREQVVMRW